ncbi:hypothetical protein MSMAT_2117 [Methanosarcina mazei TMA]|nr:hypothetical protein MSMAT_2117 [Methanosarcina mazei TMA]
MSIDFSLSETGLFCIGFEKEHIFGTDIIPVQIPVQEVDLLSFFLVPENLSLFIVSTLFYFLRNYSGSLLKATIFPLFEEKLDIN